MANSVDGQQLTEAHQRAQQRLATESIAEARFIWGRLDAEDLGGSEAAWLAVMLLLAAGQVSRSQRLAGAYFEQYSLAETGRAGDVSFAGPTGLALSLKLAGPARVKALIRGGMSPVGALEAARTKFEGIVSRQILMGGRLTIAASTGADRRARGWRRVTDGDPCAFCALMASRGPAYRSMSSAGTQYHGHCGCTAEPVYGDWVPNEAEQGFIDAYRGSSGKTLRSVTQSMRANGGFRDSPRV